MYFLEFSFKNKLYIINADSKSELTQRFLKFVEKKNNVVLIESNCFKIVNNKNKLLSPYIN